MPQSFVLLYPSDSSVTLGGYKRGWLGVWHGGNPFESQKQDKHFLPVSVSLSA
jgi:hypothetical protein